MSVLARNDRHVGQYLIAAFRKNTRVTPWHDYHRREDAVEDVRLWVDQGHVVHLIDLDEQVTQVSHDPVVNWNVWSENEVGTYLVGTVLAVDEHHAVTLADQTYDPENLRDLWVDRAPVIPARRRVVKA